MKFSNYLEAPNFDELSPRPWLFLAGGITGTPDWQTEAKKLLFSFSGKEGTLLNPRRENFDINDPDAADVQIAWEYHMLAAADAILFWFPKEEIQPIALFELGRWSTPGPLDKPIFVGAHPEYQRRKDVEVQMKLVQPKLHIFDNLEDLCAKVEESL